MSINNQSLSHSLAATPHFTMPAVDDKPVTADDARSRAEQFIERIPSYPGGYSGRGIIICAGGVKYFSNAWVCLNMLRRSGCTMPIQFWHLGNHELDEHMRELVSPYDVQCVDARRLRRKKPVRILNGWELKAYALLYCSFRELLLIDADNVPIIDPTFLFNTPQYQAYGAIFWPDCSRLSVNNQIWSYCGIDYRDEPELESGQIVLDKEKCWRPLCLAHWYNNYSDFFYQHFIGDKETFHLAFRKLGVPYASPNRELEALPGTMCQHDFEGRRIFQHRNFAKWDLLGSNQRIPGFHREEECLGYLNDLASKWDGQVEWVPYALHETAPAPVHLAAKKLTAGIYSYHRVGYDRRIIEFLPNGMVGRGHASAEIFWEIEPAADGLHLIISSVSEITCDLRMDEDGVWRGRWERFERMPVEIDPVARDPAASESRFKLFTFADKKALNLRRRFLDTLKDRYAVTVFEPQFSAKEITSTEAQIWSFRLHKIVECIEKHLGEIILFTDIDIEFFDQTLPYVENAIAYRELAVQFQHGSGINVGFLVISCSPRTREFFQRVRARVALTGEDGERVVLQMLHAGELNWNYLDRRIWACHSDDPFPPAGMVAHHATGCHGVEAKLVQLNRVAGEVARTSERRPPSIQET